MEAQVMELRMPHEEVEMAAKSIADEMANRIYHEFIFLRYSPEIELVKKGRLKAMRNKDISSFIKERLSSLS